MLLRMTLCVFGLISLPVLLGGNRLAAAEPNDAPITLTSLLGEMVNRDAVARFPRSAICVQAGQQL